MILCNIETWVCLQSVIVVWDQYESKVVAWFHDLHAELYLSWITIFHLIYLFFHGVGLSDSDEMFLHQFLFARYHFTVYSRPVSKLYDGFQPNFLDIFEES